MVNHRGPWQFEKVTLARRLWMVVFALVGAAYFLFAVTCLFKLGVAYGI